MTTNEVKKSIVRKALPKPNILQLSEYDITQKIMDSLTNACHRSVLFSIIKDSKDAPKIAEELNISLSAVYKTLVKLEELTLVEIEKFNFVEGKKVKLYKSRIGRAEITFDNNDATCLLYTSPSPRDATLSRMPSSA